MWRDAKDVAVAELVAQLRSTKRVDVVAVRQDQRVGYFLELRFPADRVAHDPTAIGVEPDFARGRPLFVRTDPQADRDAAALQRGPDLPSPRMAADDQHQRATHPGDAE